MFHKIKNAGTDIGKTIPWVSHFGGGRRKEKKQTISNKRREFSERFFEV